MMLCYSSLNRLRQVGKRVILRIPAPRTSFGFPVYLCLRGGVIVHVFATPLGVVSFCYFLGICQAGDMGQEDCLLFPV